MLHIDAATLRKYPILGVLLGGAAAVFIGCLLLFGMAEARALLGQNAPDPLSLHETVNLGRIRCFAARAVINPEKRDEWSRISFLRVPLRTL